MRGACYRSLISSDCGHRGGLMQQFPFGTWPVPFGMLFSKVFKQRQLVNSMVRNPEETRLVFSSILHWFGSHEISRRGRIRVGRRPQPFQTKALNVEQSPQPMSIFGLEELQSQEMHRKHFSSKAQSMTSKSRSFLIEIHASRNQRTLDDSEQLAADQRDHLSLAATVSTHGHCLTNSASQRM